MEDYITETITSPRKLQEMLPTPDGHDVTAASGVSMKQYEDQLNGLRKENFHLKLRVYFLEEKLGSGSPPAVQGLLEHNVRLQVEVEELRRQLTDKQELLAAAAEAIDVLEQQGSISTDSVEASIDDYTVPKKDVTDKQQNFANNGETCDETCHESESAGDYLGTTVVINQESLDELARLRRENRKALQMIKGCMKKIQQQDKEIKKIKLDKELVYAQVSDSQLEKYEEIVKCKDEYIKDLESKIKDLQTNVENKQEDSAGNLQELLTRRLQGLAFFLDKLLSNKCVLGEEKKKLAESILEQSLALPVGLKLDETMAPEDFTMDESNMDVSQLLRIEDLTMMFGHHMQCSDDGKYSTRIPRTHVPPADAMSESECWSEPDRNVSLARIGLYERSPPAVDALHTTEHRHRARRSKLSDDNKVTNESALLELTLLTKQIEQLQCEKNDLSTQLHFAKEQINELLTEKSTLNETLAAERAKLLESKESAAAVKEALMMSENKAREVEQKLSEAVKLADRLHKEKLEIESAYIETEQNLRRAADEATVQASQASLERARAVHERLRADRDLDDTRHKLATAQETIAKLQLEITQRIGLEARNIVPNEVLPSEEDRPTSPDQGIDSDRLSSLEQNDAVSLSPRSLYEENVTLKQKLARTKATLADTLTQLNAANMRKRSVQRAICREIHKTHGVLRKARDQFENQNN